jgi:hypothetical protein
MSRTGLIVALVLSATSALAAEAVTPDRFRRELVGKTLASTNKKGQDFSVTFAAGGGGTFSYAAENRPMPIRWYFSASNLCWGVPEFRTSDECSIVTLEGPDMVVFTDVSLRKVNNSYRVVK